MAFIAKFGMDENRPCEVLCHYMYYKLTLGPPHGVERRAMRALRASRPVLRKSRICCDSVSTCRFSASVSESENISSVPSA